MIFGGGSRVQKYRHILPDTYNFSPQEYALLCVLLLRGPQTVGELRGRTERMAAFPTLADVENTLTGLSEGSEPLMRLLPMRPGQKERRFVQLLSGEPTEATLEELAAPLVRYHPTTDHATRLETLEHEVAALRESLADLRRALGA